MCIDQDPWIDSKGSETPILIKNDLKGRMVRDLIFEEGLWKEEVILENFLESVAKTILNTPMGGILSPDEIIWNHDERGMFSVKSAYHLAENLASAQEASSSNGSEFDPLWRKF